jgi:hypothetical protein
MRLTKTRRVAAVRFVERAHGRGLGVARARGRGPWPAAAPQAGGPGRHAGGLAGRHAWLWPGT